MCHFHCNPNRGGCKYGATCRYSHGGPANNMASMAVSRELAPATARARSRSGGRNQFQMPEAPQVLEWQPVPDRTAAPQQPVLHLEPESEPSPEPEPGDLITFNIADWRKTTRRHLTALRPVLMMEAPSSRLALEVDLAYIRLSMRMAMRTARSRTLRTLTEERQATCRANGDANGEESDPDDLD